MCAMNRSVKNDIAGQAKEHNGEQERASRILLIIRFQKGHQRPQFEIITMALLLLREKAQRTVVFFAAKKSGALSGEQKIGIQQ